MDKAKLYVIGAFCVSFVSFAQVKTNQAVLQNSANNSSAFLDASSSPTWNGTTNQGKGMVFPKTNLTTLSTLVQSGPNTPNNFPNRMDGMIVYNTGVGAPAIGATQTPQVTEGFYYYKNTSSTLNGGYWVRIGDGSANRTISFANNVEVETDIEISGKRVYATKGTFVHDGGNSVTIPKPAGFLTMYQVKIYRVSGTNPADKNLVGTTVNSYEEVTGENKIRIIFGQGGILSLSYPEGNYEYVIEYIKS